MNNTDKIFSRAQVNAALWRVFAPFDHNVKTIHSIFKTRIKKLIETDTAARLQIEAGERSPVPTPYVFSSGPDAPGQATKYETLDVVCLAVAIELTDIGCKQSEAVELVRLARPYIHTFLRKRRMILAYSNIDPKNPVLESKRYMDLPAIERPSTDPDETEKNVFVDLRTFIVFKKYELNELNFDYDEDARHEFPKKTEASYREPVVCRGVNALTNAIDGFSLRDMRSSLIVELGYLTQETIRQLGITGNIGRGRPDIKLK